MENNSKRDNIDFRTLEYKDADDFNLNFKRKTPRNSSSASDNVDFRTVEYKNAADFQANFKENRPPGSLIPQRTIRSGTFKRPTPPSMNELHNTRGKILSR